MLKIVLISTSINHHHQNTNNNDRISSLIFLYVNSFITQKSLSLFKKAMWSYSPTEETTPDNPEYKSNVKCNQYYR